MGLKLDLERRARGFLDALPAKRFRQVAVRLFALLRDPEAPDTSALKNSPYRRADVDEYRIVYRVEGGVLLVPLIGKCTTETNSSGWGEGGGGAATRLMTTGGTRVPPPSQFDRPLPLNKSPHTSTAPHTPPACPCSTATPGGSSPRCA